MATNWADTVEDDAREMFENFADEMTEMAAAFGEVSDDLFNDYAGGDSYHHETHVDRDYGLTEAAELLDELSQYEETDEGLWEGLPPRRAIAAQAAYTYGNAVYSAWRDMVGELNAALDSFDFEDDEDRERFTRWWVPAYVWAGGRGDDDFGGRMADVRAGIMAGEAAGLYPYLDWYKETHDGHDCRAVRDIINTFEETQEERAEARREAEVTDEDRDSGDD